MFVSNRNCVIPKYLVVMLSTWDHVDPDIDSLQEPKNSRQEIFTVKICKYEVLTTKNKVYPLLEERFHCRAEN